MVEYRLGASIVIFDNVGAPIDAHFHVDENSIVFHSRGGTKGAANATNTQYSDGLRLVLGRLEASALPISGIWVDSSRVQHLPLSDRLVVSEQEARLGVSEMFRLASRRMQSVGSVARPGAGGNSNKRLRIGIAAPIADFDLAKIVAGMLIFSNEVVSIPGADSSREGPPARAIRPSANYQLIASRGALLTPGENAAALSMRVRPASVWGSDPLPEDDISKIYVPSRGFPMSFGRREVVTSDGEHFLYALRLSGDPSSILNEPAHYLRGKAIIKIGLAKNPAERCAALNAGFPPAGRVKWKLLLQSAPFADGQQALDAETALKKRFEVKFHSLGGEFFLCDERVLVSNFVV